MFCSARSQDRAAGLRTHILFSLASAVFAIISIVAWICPVFRTNRCTSIRLLMVEAFTVGVPFLAAGTIVLSRGELRGLTTGPACGLPVRLAWPSASATG
jgi:putative Mg2+ transporter-C (MgtC) family protein